MQRIWLVGASEGIGFQLCQRYLQSGCQVIASARSAESHNGLIQLQQQYSSDLFLLNCDVTESDLSDVVKQAWNAFNGIDIWLYNVGTYFPMRMAEWDLQQFEQMNQTNYLGAVKLMIPLQQLANQQQESMQWLWNISLASDFGLPYGGGYSAPKAALMNLAESLQPELAQHGIDLKVINHGFVQTRLTEKNDFPMLGLMSAEAAAERIIKIQASSKFETRFPWRLAAILATLKRLPKSISLSITRKMLR